MSRKDYAKLAAALRESKPRLMYSATEAAEKRAMRDYWWDEGRFAAWVSTVERVADELIGTNPRFDRERFVAACRKEV